MNIWVDADACPVAIREILCRAAQRSNVMITFVSNHYIPLPRQPLIRALQVEKGFDVADNEIVQRTEADDLIISSDIPLAAAAIDKGATVLSPRGELYTHENIKGRLTMRNFMDTLRSSGVDTGGPPPLSQQERQQFSNHLDKILSAHLQKQGATR